MNFNLYNFKKLVPSILFISLISFNSYSQEPLNTYFCIDSVNAEFPGGINELKKYLRRKLQNCEPNLKNGEVALLVKFTICKDGAIKDINLIKGFTEEIDRELIRVLTNSPYWKPGRRYGQPIEETFTLAIDL